MVMEWRLIATPCCSDMAMEIPKAMIDALVCAWRVVVGLLVA